MKMLIWLRWSTLTWSMTPFVNFLLSNKFNTFVAFRKSVKLFKFIPNEKQSFSLKHLRNLKPLPKNDHFESSYFTIFSASMNIYLEYSYNIGYESHTDYFQLLQCFFTFISYSPPSLTLFCSVIEVTLWMRVTL